jgi:hypothetical protein
LGITEVIRPAIFANTEAPDKREAFYDLSCYPTTFDMAAWCVIVKTMGANHVRFVYDGRMASWKYPEEIAWRRFANILIPMCSLAGMSWSVERTRNGFTANYHVGHVNEMYKQKGRIEKLQAVTDSKKRGYITITLRDSIRNKWRDSNKQAWERVRKDLERNGREVVVIRDGEYSPLDLRKRMELYQYADMNLGVSCGPITLCYLSEAPYRAFNLTPNEEMERFLEKGGMPKGSQFAFRNDKQKLVWEPDSYEVISRELEAAL